MATASLELISALRKTAQTISESKTYQWGHMGACNCGNLAQVITNFTKAEIHQYALSSREGDWSQMAEEYCPTSGLPVDMMISAMVNKGISTDDIRNLEYLSDKNVLALIPKEQLPLSHNKKADVVYYILKWAELLENQLLSSIDISDLERLKESV